MSVNGVARVIVALGAILVTGCAGSGRGHVTARAGAPGQHFTVAQQVSFLHRCGVGPLGGALGDAAVCECALTQLEAEANRVPIEPAVATWVRERNGEGFRSVPMQAINRCMGEQEIGPNPEPGPAGSSQPSSTHGAVAESTTKAARRLAWPPSRSAVVRTCVEGTAVANGMTCQLAGAIERAYGEYPDSSTPDVRHLRVVDPLTDHSTRVVCFFSGREKTSAVCDASGDTAELLPPAGASS